MSQSVTPENKILFRLTWGPCRLNSQFWVNPLAAAVKMSDAEPVLSKAKYCVWSQDNTFGALPFPSASPASPSRMVIVLVVVIFLPFVHQVHRVVLSQHLSAEIDENFVDICYLIGQYWVPMFNKKGHRV